jgi:hypothetical protein
VEVADQVLAPVAGTDDGDIFHGFLPLLPRLGSAAAPKSTMCRRADIVNVFDIIAHRTNDFGF